MIGELNGPMALALDFQGYHVAQVVPGAEARAIGARRFEADFHSLESLDELHALLAGPDDRTVGGLINFLPLSPPYDRRDVTDAGAALDLNLSLFNFLKTFADDLHESAARGGGWAINFTGLDGQFGLRGTSPLPVAQAGTIGLIKAVAREWPDVRVQTIDLDFSGQTDPTVLFTHVFEEILSERSAVEVGVTAEGRWHLQLKEDAALSGAMPPDLDLGPDAVVLVTGGAYGITAEVTKRLVEAANPHLVVVGRSPLPGPEPAEVAALPDAAALRAHLIREMQQNDAAVSPAAVERAVRRVLKEREIRATLAAYEQACRSVTYHAVDVRDADAFGALIDALYEKHGRLDGVIHGAGIIEDKLLKDKMPDSFERVFTTKVQSAATLAEKLRPDSLRFLAFFSSVSGRFGNAGQSDYGAANEYLNKLAAHLDQAWPARVVALGWGPWDGGMISDGLRRLYAARGIGLIPVEDGARRFLEEIARPAGAAPEVLLGCGVRQMAGA